MKRKDRCWSSLLPLKLLKTASSEELPFKREVTLSENATASAFPVATRLELVDKSCCGVSERTTIKWINTLHFESRFSGTAARCRDLQLLSRDLEDGRATRSAGACAACPAAAGAVI